MKIVDVSGKFKTRRVTTAVGYIKLSPKTLNLIRENKIPKGNVIEASKLSALYGVKNAQFLLPFCHSLNIDNVEVSVDIKQDGIEVKVSVMGIERTGYEMEALTGVSIALLNIYDMCKGIDNSMIIEDIRLIKKSGGKSDYASEGEEIDIYILSEKRFGVNNNNIKFVSPQEYRNYKEKKSIFITFYDEVPENFIEARIEGLESVIAGYMFEQLGIKGCLSPIIGFTKKGIGIVMLSSEEDYVRLIIENVLPLVVMVVKEYL